MNMKRQRERGNCCYMLLLMTVTQKHDRTRSRTRSYEMMRRINVSAECNESATFNLLCFNQSNWQTNRLPIILNAQISGLFVFHLSLSLCLFLSVCLHLHFILWHVFHVLLCVFASTRRNVNNILNENTHTHSFDEEMKLKGICLQQNRLTANQSGKWLFQCFNNFLPSSNSI